VICTYGDAVTSVQVLLQGKFVEAVIMAIVLDAFASYISHLLKQVAEQELGMLLGVSHDIDKMGDKLHDLKNFLADAERRRITDKSVQGWVNDLKRVMYDATNIIDLCQLKAMERGRPSAANMKCFNHLLFCLQNPLYAHDIGSRIKSLNDRLDTINERSATFRFANLGSYEDRGNKVAMNGNKDRETSGELDLSGVVGEKIEEDTRRLVEIMLKQKGGNKNNVMVVAIVGVGGIGKTTLAQKVFNDEAIRSEFDKKIWLSVNQEFDKAELLRTAITLAEGDHRGEKALAVLQPTLTATLKANKILLVMDDVWNQKAWEDALKIPLVNAAAPGSCILITTRYESVARGMTAVEPYHHIAKLKDEDAWSLLKKQVLSK
jgi:ribosomal protein S24E